MAITVISEPQIYSPVYNDLFFEVSSDNTAQPGFSYIFDIYFDAALQTRHRIPARPGDGHGLFNAMRIMESEVYSESLSNLTDTFKTHPEYWKKFSVQYGEEYEITGIPNLFTNIETSSDIFATNAVFDYLDYIGYDDTTYLLASSSQRFLTNAPDQKIKLLENAWLYTMNDTPADYSRRQVNTYDSSGTLVQTYNTDNTFTSDTDDNKFIRVTSGTAQLLSELGSTTFDGVAYYTVECQKSDGTPISEAKKYVLDTNCTKYDPVRIHFLNKLGTFDSFTFTLVSKGSSAIKTTGFQKTYTNTKSTSDRLLATSSTVVADSLMLNSNYVSEQEALWLTELLTSPIIFREVNGAMIALKCKETKFDQKKSVNEKIFNLVVNFDYTYLNQRQRY